MQYHCQHTVQLVAELRRNNKRKMWPYCDIFDGLEYQEAVLSGDVMENDTMLVFSIDGVQLYCNKSSNYWIYIWLVMDLAPGKQYQKKHILPGTIIPSPNSQRNLDSFIFPGLYYKAAVQHKGLLAWNTLTGSFFVSNLYLILGTADGPEMAYLNRCVGNYGHMHCQFQSPIVSCHKPGGSHYYPTQYRPMGYTVLGYNHPNVDIKTDLWVSNSMKTALSYQKDLHIIMQSTNKAQYEWN